MKLYRVSFYTSKAMASLQEIIAIRTMGETIVDRIVVSEVPLEYDDVRAIAEAQPGFIKMSSWDDITDIYDGDPDKVMASKRIDYVKEGV
jgi:hypothetical protein